QVGPARRRRHDTAVMAHEELRTEIALQVDDLVADGAGCHVQLGAGELEARQPRRGLEGAQRVERRQLLHARSLLNEFFSCKRRKIGSKGSAGWRSDRRNCRRVRRMEEARAMPRPSFRAALSAERPLVTPLAHDALSARLIERAGFKAFTIGGS